MATLVDPAVIRRILGSYDDASIPDDVLVSDEAIMAAEMIAAEWCPSHADIDPADVDAVASWNTGIAYIMAAQRLQSGRRVLRASLGEQSVTFMDDQYNTSASQWMDTAKAFIARACPVTPVPIDLIGRHFGVARGRRG